MISGEEACSFCDMLLGVMPMMFRSRFVHLLPPAFRVACLLLQRFALKLWVNIRLTIVTFRAGNAHDRDSWESIQAIKSRILRIWEGAPPPVRICCIKFAQRVVLAQTMSNGMDSNVRYGGDLFTPHKHLLIAITAIRPRRVTRDNTTEPPLARPAAT